MKTLAAARRIAWLLFYGALATASAGFLASDVRENLGYAPVAQPYEARIVKYEGLAVARSKRAFVEVRLADGSTATFGSKKTGRYQLFSVGESVRLVQRATASGSVEYEIASLLHRYGWSALYGLSLIFFGSMATSDLVRWYKQIRRRARRSQKAPGVPGPSALPSPNDEQGPELQSGWDRPPPLTAPCCSQAQLRYLEDLPHVYQFDFDLYQCPQCSRYWVYAWRAGRGGWETATENEARQMQSLQGAELRAFMKTWAKSFN